MSNKKDTRGQTLIELLVALGVIAIILSMTTAIYMQCFNHYFKVSADVDAQSEARMAMGRATQQLRQAMTDPNQPPGPPIMYPTPNNNPTPPVANSVNFREISYMPPDADYNNATYQCVTIETTPSPGRANPDLVVVKDDCAGTTLSTTTIGRDVSSFLVSPVTTSTYDVQITVTPQYGMEQGAQATPSPGPVSSYTVNSRIFVSYYQ